MIINASSFGNYLDAEGRKRNSASFRFDNVRITQKLYDFIEGSDLPEGHAAQALYCERQLSTELKMDMRKTKPVQALRTVDNFLEQAISPSLIALMERTCTEQAEARQPCSGEDELEAAQSEMIWATRANGLCSARLYHTISEKICTKTGTTVKRAACIYKTPFAFGPFSPARQGAGHEQH